MVAALLPGRGFWRRSSRRFGELAAAPAGDQHDAAWPLLAGIGGVATGGPLPAGPNGPAGPEEDGDEVRPGWRSRRSGYVRRLVTAASGQGTPPLVAALEAAELLESAHTTLVLPTSPHASAPPWRWRCASWPPPSTC